MPCSKGNVNKVVRAPERPLDGTGASMTQESLGGLVLFSLEKTKPTDTRGAQQKDSWKEAKTATGKLRHQTRKKNLMPRIVQHWQKGQRPWGISTLAVVHKSLEDGHV